MKSHKKQILFMTFYVLLIFLVFREWFTAHILSASDFPPLYKSFLQYRSVFPYAWDPLRGNGFGGNTLPLLWNYIAQQSPITFFENYLNMPWIVIERLLFFYPFLLLSFFSSYLLCKHFIHNKFFSLLSPLIFIFNTYVLLVIGGGQVMIALAYSFSPIILLVFKKIADDSKHYLLLSILASLLLTIETLLDFRISFIIMLAVFIYWVTKQFLYGNLRSKEVIYSFFYTFIVPGIITALLNAFWLLPVLLLHQNPVKELGSSYSTIGAVQYFSFAKLENVIGILHPNWPENIFGLVHFMKPEFLVSPVLAYASLLFVRKKDKKETQYVLYFALLGLIGAFLSKGTNDPFGFVYLWIFNHIPGFDAFRDPTKWYVLIAISYSILIPFSIWKISERVSSIKYNVLKEHGKFIIVFIFVLFWLFTIRQAISGQLGGTFKPTTIPQEYISLEKFLANQSQFSRTLWVPTLQVFGFYSNTHPEIPAQDLFSNYNLPSLVEQINKPQTEILLQEASVKYIVVPYDSQDEIFLTDRKYDDKKYEATVNSLNHVSWLQRLSGFGKIAIFAVPDQKAHFWIVNGSKSVSYQVISPVEYKISVVNARAGNRLVFTESFDKYWVARVPDIKYQASSIKYDKSLNSFVLPRDGNYTVDVYYTPQRWVNIGLVISLTTLVLIVVSLILLRLKSRDLRK